MTPLRFAILLFVALATTVNSAATQTRSRSAADLQSRARALLRDRTATAQACLDVGQRAWKSGDPKLAIELYDRGFELEPDHPPLLAEIDRLADSIRFNLPLPKPPAVWSLEEAELERAIQRTFLHASKLPPTLREFSVLRLRDAAHSEQVRTQALAALASRRAPERAFAGLVLRRLFAGQAADELIERSLLDIDRDVRKQAALGLARVADPAVAGPAVRALGSKHGLLRIHAAEALGWMGHAEAVPPLVEAYFASNAAPDQIAAAPRAFAFFGTQTAYVQDFDVEIATGSSIADPVINVLSSGAVLDVRVVGTSEASVKKRFDDAAMASLRRLTGEDPGKRKRDWRAWWKDTDANPANVPSPSDPSDEDGGTPEESGRYVP